mmetsp:Transcript_11419/g.20626  ORF Transcript_11419/g.20626 Transcript_11419/m.20626 type:complete len:230 (+) Transcript_11419:346-1035(+)
MPRIRRIDKKLPPIDNKRINPILLALQRFHHDHRPRHEFRILHAIPHAARRLKLRLRQLPSSLLRRTTIQYRFLLLLVIANARQVLPYLAFVPFQLIGGYIIPPLDQCDRTALDMSQMRIVDHGRHAQRIRPVQFHPQSILQRLHPALRSPLADHVAVRAQYDDVVRHVLFVRLGQQRTVGVGEDVMSHVVSVVSAAHADVSLGRAEVAREVRVGCFLVGFWFGAIVFE